MGCQDLQPKLSLEHGQAVIESVAFSPDGGMLASADLQRVILWDVSTGTKVRALEKRLGRIKKVAWHPDGATLITNGEGIVFWDVATGVERGAIEPGERISIRRFALAPTAKQLRQPEIIRAKSGYGTLLPASRESCCPVIKAQSMHLRSAPTVYSWPQVEATPQLSFGTWQAAESALCLPGTMILSRVWHSVLTVKASFQEAARARLFSGT